MRNQIHCGPRKLGVESLEKRELLATVAINDVPWERGEGLDQEPAIVGKQNQAMPLGAETIGTVTVTIHAFNDPPPLVRDNGQRFGDYDSTTTITILPLNDPPPLESGDHNPLGVENGDGNSRTELMPPERVRKIASIDVNPDDPNHTLLQGIENTQEVDEFWTQTATITIHALNDPPEIENEDLWREPDDGFWRDPGQELANGDQDVGSCNEELGTMEMEETKTGRVARSLSITGGSYGGYASAWFSQDVSRSNPADSVSVPKDYTTCRPVWVE
jgi:hypothetical protein